jgi:PIN domain nuclease of toxin-antitoxin system
LGGAARLRLLLDTHIWAWGLLEPERLPSRVATALEREDNERWLSSISVWEILLLFEKGRLESPPDPTKWIREKLEVSAMREAILNHEVALEGRNVRLPHGDPADRLIIATARVYELTLVTADERLIRARSCRLLSARR